MDAMISRKEAIDIMCAGGVFSIHFTTLDKGRKKQSRHMHFARAEKVGARHNLVQHRQIAVKSLDDDRPQVAVNLVLINRINGRLVA